MSKYSTRLIQSNEILKMQNLVSLTIANYGNATVYFIIDQIKRSLPPINTTLNVPSASFEMFFGGQIFDVEINFELPISDVPPGQTLQKKIIIDYLTNNNC